jgi:hypothetical protein
MVIIFGWSFASGPVIYWATQSVYSVIQQWFITGWGSLKDWLPWLPEMPEHRRLGYHPPRDLDDVVVVSGDAAAARPQKGIQGWLMKRMEDAQKQAAERQQATREARGQTSQTGKTGQNGSRASRTRPNAVGDGAADDAGDEIETTATDERAANHRGSNTNRRSSSYQERVDAATKFSGRLARESEPLDGDSDGAENGAVQRTNGRATSRGDGQATGQSTGRATSRANGSGRAIVRQGTPPRRPRKKRR